ncbi:hypothetical protein GCM10023206_02430 [Acinetobacter puyangensis]|uniref:Glycosyl transferase family 8 n=1 Tax=Acinetobacter puyangensis TaxID=1096779 RepID=A0A240E754_9GAMM|nr:hypothetical protein [Acinetobacter puyangensis]SNX44406.1 hypothetical protein SAMN05421731_103144 [Acinetobacter puyangensis]
MLLFVTSMIHPQACEDYNKKISLLNKLIDSLSHQKNQNFKLIICFNEIPDIRFPSFVKAVQLDIDIPKSYKETGKISYEDIRLDKGSKLCASILFGLQFSPKYIMIIDSDDFININLVDYILNSEYYDLFVVNTGFKFNASTQRIKKMDNFYETCGSCFIFSTEALEIDTNLKFHSTNFSISDIKNNFNDIFITNTLGSHKFSLNSFKENQKKIKFLEFPAVLYNVGTSVNHSRFSSSKFHWWNSKKATQSFLIDFGIKELN